MPFVVGAFVGLGCVWAADQTGAWIFWILAPVALVVGVRPSLTSAPQGLIVTNLLPRRYLWEDIAAVERAMARRCFFASRTGERRRSGR
jgi:hypothetical protein